MKRYIIGLMLQKNSGNAVTFSQALHGVKGESLTLNEAVGTAMMKAMQTKPDFSVGSVIWMNADDFDDCGNAGGTPDNPTEKT